MTTITTKKRDIKYLNRDFQSLKQDFIEHLRIYFPDTVQDFNESNTAMIFLELVAFMGDNLSFYLDRRFEESFIETAKESKNVFKHAKQLGYKVSGKAPATGKVDGFLRVPAITTDQEVKPDMRYAGEIIKGAKCKGGNGVVYETVDRIDFSTVDSSNPFFVQVGDVDSATKTPISFVLKVEGIDIKAGETKTHEFIVAEHKSFRKLTLPDEDVIEILSVIDSDGNEWYEVDYLAQDTVFTGLANTGDASTEVPTILKLKSVPYRFVSEYDVSTNKTSFIFGTGDAEVFDGELIPNLGDLSLPLFGRDAFSGFSIDPQNFLKTRTMGLAPVNTTLTVSYRVGGGIDTNAGSEEVDSVISSIFDVGNSTLDLAVIKDVGASFEIVNPAPIEGGRDQLSNDEIRQLSSANFATQNRIVTTPDFIVRSMSMPAKYGSIFRVNAKPSVLNRSAIELIVLSKDSNGHVSVAPADLKSNLKTYLSKFRMMTDAIEILDGEVINVAIDFEILSVPGANKVETLANCITSLKSFFEIDSWQINQPINLTDVSSVLSAIPDVLSIIKLDFVNRIGNYDSRGYSSTSHNIRENTQNGIVYAKENAIFEVKYLGKDIFGVAK